MRRRNDDAVLTAYAPVRVVPVLRSGSHASKVLELRLATTDIFHSIKKGLAAMIL